MQVACHKKCSLSQIWCDRLSIALGAALTLVTLWLFLISTAAVVVLRTQVPHSGPSDSAPAAMSHQTLTWSPATQDPFPCCICLPCELTLCLFLASLLVLVRFSVLYTFLLASLLFLCLPCRFDRHPPPPPAFTVSLPRFDWHPPPPPPLPCILFIDYHVVLVVSLLFACLPYYTCTSPSPYQVSGCMLSLLLPYCCVSALH